MARLAANRERFLAFLERRVGARDVAEDLLQDAFVRGIERAAQVHDHDSAIAWFYRALRNTVIDHWRRRGAERRALERATRDAKLDVEALEAEVYEVVCRCASELLPTLKPEYAEVLTAVDLGGEGVSQVAGRLGITANHAAVRLHRARRALRSQVERCCATPTSGAADCGCDPRGSADDGSRHRPRSG